MQGRAGLGWLTVVIAEGTPRFCFEVTLTVFLLQEERARVFLLVILVPLGFVSLPRVLCCPRRSHGRHGRRRLFCICPLKAIKTDQKRSKAIKKRRKKMKREEREEKRRYGGERESNEEEEERRRRREEERRRAATRGDEDETKERKETTNEREELNRTEQNRKTKAKAKRQRDTSFFVFRFWRETGSFGKTF